MIKTGTTNEYLSTTELLALSAAQLREIRRDAKESLEIVQSVAIRRDDIDIARRELPAFVRRIDRALAAKRKGMVRN